jgi:hypothetical protein
MARTPRRCDISSFFIHLTRFDLVLLASPGTFQPSEGKSFCPGCGNGTYSDSAGQRSCTPCSPGRFQNTTGKTVCVDCFPGFNQPQEGQPICKPCANGTYVTARGQPSCLPCQVGYHASSPGHSTCAACNLGQFQDAPGQKDCKNCNITYWTNTLHATICTACVTGTFGNKTGCYPCQAGRFNNQLHQRVCRKCLPGTFTKDIHQTKCSTCPDGKVAFEYGRTECLLCPTNGFANFAKTECVCNEGYYLPTYKGDSVYTCIPCPIGADCSNTGNTWLNLRSLAGWWRSSNISTTFYRCPIRSQCLSSLAQGGPADGLQVPVAYDDEDYTTQDYKPSLVSKSSAFTNDESLPDNCAPPYFTCSTLCKNNRAAALCTRCLPHFREDISGVCTPCPTGSTNIGLMVLIILGVIVGVWFMFWIVLRSGQEAFNLTTAEMFEDDEQSFNMSDASGSESDGPAKKKRARTDDSGSEEDSQSDSGSGSSSGSAIDSERNEDASSSSEYSSSSESSDSEVETETAEPVNLDPMVVYGPPPPTSDFTYKLKIFVGFIQIVSALGSGLDIQWPNTFKEFVSYFDIINMDFLLSNVTSADCLFSSDVYYTQFTATVVAPMAILFCSVVFVLLPKYFECLCFKHSTVQERARSTMKFWKLFLYLLFLIYPSVSSTVLRHFVCKQIDDHSYLLTDLRIQCYTDIWTTFAFIAIALILIYPIGIPVFFFALLKLNQKDLREPRIKAQLGFLYAGYRLEVWWWELADCVNKLVLTSLLAFATIEAQLPLGMCVVAVFTFGLLHFQPYLRQEDDLLALFAQVEIFLFLLAGDVFFHLDVAEYAYKDDLIMSVALIILTIGFFFGFLLFIGRILYQMGREFLEKRERRLAKEQAKAEATAKKPSGGNDDESEEEPENGSTAASEVEASRSGSASASGSHHSGDEEASRSGSASHSGSQGSKKSRSGGSNQGSPSKSRSQKSEADAEDAAPSAPEAEHSEAEPALDAPEDAQPEAEPASSHSKAEPAAEEEEAAASKKPSKSAEHSASKSASAASGSESGNGSESGSGSASEPDV